MKPILNILFCLFCLICTDSYASNKFYEERFRGFIWFEDKEKEEIKRKEEREKHIAPDISETHQVTDPQEAKALIQRLTQELDDKNSLMLVNRSPESVRDYWKASDKLWKVSSQVENSWRQAMLLYPEYANLKENPINVHAVKAKRTLERVEKENKIKQFASSYSLVFFASSTCKYCEEFAPVLKNFVSFYGFNLEGVADKEINLAGFNLKANPNLAAMLGINTVPCVVAVKKGGSEAFKIFEGFASFSELEEYTEYAIKHIENAASKGATQ